jgi:sugar O-acyltransferase (sialic acid O-acetyltransferase NeuD family)
MTPLCVILGGGGHARVILDILQASGSVGIYGILDSDSSRWGTEWCGTRVVGGDEQLPALIRRGVTLFAVGLGGVGDNRPRQRLFELALEHRLEPLTVIHATAVVSSRVTVGRGCQLLPGSIVNAGAEVGVNVIVNTGAIIEHDCRLGHHVHVATGARMSGGVHIGDRAHIGTGAVVRQSVSIGSDAVVGAGAVVIADVPPGTVVVGNPARRLRGRT